MGFKNFDKSNDIKEEDLKKESKKVQKLYNEYKDKSEDELVAELYKYVQKQKDNGTFDYDSLSNMLEKISPFLSAQQKQKMKEILVSLK